MSVATLHRVARAMAARYEVERLEIDRAVRDQGAIPTDAVTIQVGIDGAMVPQDGEHAKPRGRKTEEPAPPRHEPADRIREREDSKPRNLPIGTG